MARKRDRAAGRDAGFIRLLLSLALKWAETLGTNGHAGGDRHLFKALQRVTSDPARVAGLDAGHLRVGAAADEVLFDPAERWLVEAGALASQGKHTPSLGYEMPGRVKATIAAGQLAYERKAA